MSGVEAWNFRGRTQQQARLEVIGRRDAQQTGNFIGIRVLGKVCLKQLLVFILWNENDREECHLLSWSVLSSVHGLGSDVKCQEFPSTKLRLSISRPFSSIFSQTNES
jgi:hypothetical protein